jgi:hypothetical protein
MEVKRNERTDRTFGAYKIIIFCANGSLEYILTHFSQLVGSFKRSALYLRDKCFIVHSGQQLIFDITFKHKRKHTRYVSMTAGSLRGKVVLQ